MMRAADTNNHEQSMSTPGKDTIEELCSFAMRVAEEAGAVARSFFDNPGVVEAKGGGKGFDPLTQADKQAEARMREMIAARWPDHAISGEEGGDKEGASAFRWLLDPIDGTRAFVCGLPTWTVLAAVLHEGRPLIGVAHQPLLDVTWLGAPGGAWRIDGGGRKPLSVSSTGRLSEALAGTTLPEIYRDRREKRLLGAMAENCRMLRYDADAMFYLMVAEGRMDIAFDTGLAPYDIAALIPIIKGAGGVITGWDGADDPLGGQVMAASSRELLDEALSLLG